MSCRGSAIKQQRPAAALAGEEVRQGDMSDPELHQADEPTSLIKALHDSEINGEIGSFYDGLWRAQLGDPGTGM